MFGLAVESVMVTVCEDVYVPVAGEITGVAAGGCVEPLDEYVQEKICCVAVCPPVPPVEPTKTGFSPTVRGGLMVPGKGNRAFCTGSVLVHGRVVAFVGSW